jgi:chromosome segregation ATPase
MYYLGTRDMKNRMITYEQRADEEQMELVTAQQEAPPLSLHELPPELNIFVSDSSESGSSVAEPLTVAESDSSTELVSPGLAQQLDRAVSQAKRMEAVLEKLHVFLANAELNIWTLRSDKGRLMDRLDEVTWEMGVQTNDLAIHKGLLDYQERARQALVEQLTHTTKTLLDTLKRLNEAQTTINELQAQIIDLETELTPWE